MWDSGVQFDNLDLFSNDEIFVYENFDNEYDITFDHSGNQNHGTIVGATWEELILGCVDPEADNYNSDASFDDGSCTFWKLLFKF